ncbi:Crp/Fnr family transcriptional regulator [Mucilaginibacter pallidiroseus]|uniref:Crp/Fnr family transcriptional regulator n=1 Tax=Mucilaginibacter pallidiroseus TaxID=2599295 RepID=A0A563U7Y3_9SPHI|nr:Crp/Fnr family transcriptional regulator [Mucilaginibacter pallidiroseus]TWR27424.1 Crp/Fnr family transcriptional regulator [Mucilaginibacter pallidiroseus]
MDEVTDAQLKQFRARLAAFVEFNEAEWIVMTQYISVKQLKKKAHFVEPGEVCKYLGFVATGSVRYFHIIDGKDITNYFSFENDFVSSYKSFLTGETCISYIEALEPSTILVVSKKNWEEMLNNPMLAYKIERLGRLIAEYYLICYEDRLTGFITQTPEERYLQLLENGKDIIRRMPQHYIANFLGITPVSLSRMRKRIMVNSR